MQARKVAILLALTALSILTLFVVSLIDGQAFAAEAGDRVPVVAVPDTLDFYRETVAVASDGSAEVEIALVLSRGGGGSLQLPFAFAAARDFEVLTGPAVFAHDSLGREVPVQEVLGHLQLDLVLDGSAVTGDSIAVRALVPEWFDRGSSLREYGEFEIGRRFVNTSGLVMRRFEMAVDLPEGMLVHSILAVDPPFSPKKSPRPPYEVGRGAERGWAVLRTKNLGPAQSVLLDLSIRPARRGPIPLVLGLLAAALYLVFFRDVLKPKETE